MINKVNNVINARPDALRTHRPPTDTHYAAYSYSVLY